MINFKGLFSITSVSFLLTLGSPNLVIAAESVTFSIIPLGQFDVSVKSLTTFAKTGIIDSDFEFYSQHLKPEELDKLRELLNHSFNFNSIEVFRFFDTAFGKEIAQQLGHIIDAPANQSQPLLEGAIITAAENSNGFKIIDVINVYDSPKLVLNLNILKNTINEADNLYQATDRIFDWLSRREDAIPSAPTLLQPLTLAEPGTAKWTKKKLTIIRPNGRSLKVVVYLPRGNAKPAPLIIISPGMKAPRCLQRGIRIKKE